MSLPINHYKRQIAQRPIRKVLIVCEGEKTEPNYFKDFKTRGELIWQRRRETGGFILGGSGSRFARVGRIPDLLT